MRRVGIALPIGLVAALAGCSSFRDIFTSHSETAARVGSLELKSAQVAQIITRLGGPNPNPQAAEAVTGVWVDLQLFAHRVAAGGLEADSALFDRILWPQMAQSAVSAFHDTVVSRRPEMSANAVDSVYAGNDIRIFQHILFAPATATPSDSAKARADAERVLPQARTGDFAKLAARWSNDNANKNDGGNLGPNPRGTFAKEFDDAAWLLGPGEVSSLVKTQFGLHIIRRPPLSEVRERLDPHVKQRYVFHHDSIYLAKLNADNQLEVKSGAVAAIRNAATDLTAASKSGKVLVTYRNGDFRVRDLAKWLGALPPASLNQIRETPDSVLTNFVKNLAQNGILLRQADSAGIKPSPEVRAGLIAQLQGQIADLKQVSGLSAPELADSSKAPPSDRRRIAAEKISDYFEKLSTNQAQFRPIPPMLSAELRQTGDFKIYQAGVARAMELVAAQQRQDSAAATPGAPAAPGLQPAPGGPPVPGKTP